METEINQQIPEVPVAMFPCSRCGELWTVDEMNLARGANKEGWYCNVCKEQLEQEVEPGSIVFLPAFDAPEVEELRKLHH